MAIAQSFQISLSGTIYSFRLYWNPVNEYWVADISDSSNNPVVFGVPIIPGVFLLEQYAYLGFPGDLFTQQSDNSLAQPGYVELGTTAQLYYSQGVGAGAPVT